MSSLNNSNENLEAKRRQNLEDNRRFLATLKINDIRDEIKQMSDHTEYTTGRRALKKSMSSDMIRRSSRIRQNTVHNENVPPPERRFKKKKTDENQTNSMPKVKLQLPEHMLIRYHSTTKKVALHNTKAKLGGEDENKTEIMSSEKEENASANDNKSEEQSDSSNKTEKGNEKSDDQKDSEESNEESETQQDSGKTNEESEEDNKDGEDDQAGKSASSGGHVSTGPERFVEVGGSGGSAVQKGHGVEAMVHH
ncbi:unnamed protein product [Adineta ricciae]|uniref:Uncharacterized protein n=1 Tax=Adineta ricciae TaxID=249248 RepID=A0A814AYC8_ADIRI|nr:unnamed protein product [Adineta ricciae]CAF1244327.1 unnamed protein product [Adineta ricciae]